MTRPVRILVLALWLSACRGTLTSPAGQAEGDGRDAAAPADGAVRDVDAGQTVDAGSPVDASAAPGSLADGGADPSDGGADAGSPRVPGFAGTPSDGRETTTGGGDLVPELVDSCDALRAALEVEEPRVVALGAGSVLDCRSSGTTRNACRLQCSSAAASPVFYRVPVGDQTCTSLADFNGDGTLEVPAGVLEARPVSQFSIRVASNKTLVGQGSGATLLGVSLDIEAQSNIVIQNLHLSEVNPDLVEAGDGITINRAHHVWIDHVRFSRISDGYADIRDASRAITVSHTHFDGRNEFACGGKHPYVMLVDGSDVTLAENFFDEASGRNPKVVGASRVHLFSNYYVGISYFCAGVGEGAQARVEGNVYLDSRYPHWGEGGAIVAQGNAYLGTTSQDGRDQEGEVFTPPYDYVIEPAVAEVVPETVGPRGM